MQQLKCSLKCTVRKMYVRVTEEVNIHLKKVEMGLAEWKQRTPTSHAVFTL